eukprot:6187104-Pleurochrysis_carterae.AAC.2
MQGKYRKNRPIVTEALRRRYVRAPSFATCIIALLRAGAFHLVLRSGAGACIAHIEAFVDLTSRLSGKSSPWTWKA